jgi:hypothetical protein
MMLKCARELKSPLLVRAFVWRELTMPAENTRR